MSLKQSSILWVLKGHLLPIRNSRFHYSLRSNQKFFCFNNCMILFKFSVLITKDCMELSTQIIPLFCQTLSQQLTKINRSEWVFPNPLQHMLDGYILLSQFKWVSNIILIIKIFLAQFSNQFIFINLNIYNLNVIFKLLFNSTSNH